MATMSCFKRLGNSSFVMLLHLLPEGLVFYSPKIFLQLTFKGLKNATSRSCSKAFGGKAVNLMLFNSQMRNTSQLMCELKLSPITTLVPCCFLRRGSIRDTNQSSKTWWPNQTDFDRLYLAPSGPFSIPVDHNFSDL